MPDLINAGYDPISVAGVIDRRKNAPADVVDEWRNNSFLLATAQPTMEGRMLN